MRNLQDFCPPPDGQLTVCEINGRVHSMNSEFANVNTFTTAVQDHPQIHIRRHDLHFSATGDEAKALFLPVDVPFLKRVVQIYYEHGLRDALQAVAERRSLLVSRVAFAVLKVLRLADRVCEKCTCSARKIDHKILSELSQSRGWASDPVRCFAWHPICTKLAVAGLDDVVRVYSCNSTFVPLLKCKRQKNITCMAWRPMSVSDIAVGCENEIIVWNVDPASVVQRPSMNNAIILHRIEHKGIMSLAWSPQGDILASAAVCDPTVLMWDVEMDKASPLKRPGYSGNILVRWSATRERLLTASDGLVFRVWNCHKWQGEKWVVQFGRVQTACWSQSGTHLFFATNLEPTIYALTFSKSSSIFVSEKDNSSNLAVPLFDLTRTDLDGVVVGGPVQTMDMDPTDSYLAVLFRDSNCIAIFNVQTSPSLRIMANTLIAGFPEEAPSYIEFQKNFKHGACLTISWSSGRLQHYPIINSQSSDFISSKILDSSLNSFSFHGSFFN